MKTNDFRGIRRLLLTTLVGANIILPSGLALAEPSEPVLPESLKQTLESNSAVPAATSPAAPAKSETSQLPGRLEFTVVLDDIVDSRDAGNGYIRAHLKTDLKQDGKLIAPAGSVVKGRVEALDKDGNLVQTQAPKSKRLAKHEAFGVIFFKISAKDPEGGSIHVLKMKGVPPKQKVVLNNGKDLRAIEFAQGGIVRRAEPLEIEGPIQLRPGDEFALRNMQGPTTGGAAAEAEAKSNSLTEDSSSENAKPAKSSSALKHAGGKPGVELSAGTAIAMSPSTRIKSANANSADHSGGGDGAETAGEKSAGASGAETSVAENPDSETPQLRDASGLTGGSASSSEEKQAEETSSDSGDVTGKASKTKSGKLSAKSEKLPSNKSAAKAAAKEPLPKKPVAHGPLTNLFRIQLRTPIDSEFVKAGEQVVGVLLEDVKVHKNVIAKKDSAIYGRVEASRPSCRWTNAVATNDKRFQRNAYVKVSFSAIVTKQGKQIAIDGEIPEQETVFNNAGAFKTIVVNGNREIWGDHGMDESSKAFVELPKAMARLGVQAAMSSGAALAMPLLMAQLVTSAGPQMAKGFEKTFISKGNELRVAPGDEVFVQARLQNSEDEQESVSGKVMQFNAKIK